MPLNYDALTTTTEKYYLKPLVDNVFNATVLLRKLSADADPAEGGEKLKQPLIYAENSAAGSYSKYDILSTTPSDELTAALFAWKQLYCNVSISGLEEAQNRGARAVLNLVKSKMQVAELTLKKLMTTQLFSDGTGNSGKDITGIHAAIDDGTNVATYGEIDRTTYTWWKAKRYANGGVDRVPTLTLMQTAYGSISDDTEFPDLIVTTQTIWDWYWAQLTPQQRYENEQRSANVGFRHLMFNQTPIIVDKACTAKRMYMINTKYLKLRPHEENAGKFRQTGWKKPTNQDAAVNQMLWYGNLTCSNCSKQAVIEDLAP
ncbi:MAG: phage major capsid protein [Bacillota bacterium]